MDCTIITYTDWKKEIRYWIDPIKNTKDIETYLYSNIPDSKVEEIKNATTENVQALLQSL